MDVLYVRATAPVASFRRPLDHNYQRTLPLPPPTTVLGLAAAALGLSNRALWAGDSPLEGVHVAAWAEGEPGRARDMWTIRKIKGGKIAERSPYFRELLFFARFALLFGGHSSLLRDLQGAFLDPVYPLSLGREDELVLVEEARVVPVSPGEPRFRGTVVPGDLREIPFRPVLEPGSRFEPFVVETLPLAFSLDARGVRHPARQVALTFLTPGMEVEVPGFRQALAWEGRNFLWMTDSTTSGLNPA